MTDSFVLNVDPLKAEEAIMHSTKKAIVHQLLLLTMSLVAVIPFVTSVAFGQAVSARLVGAVQDSTKSRIVAATIEVRETDTGLTTDTTTNSQGEYTFPHLTPGHYAVTAKAPGFEAVEIKDLVLEIGDAKTLDVVLVPAAASQSVEVIESTPTVDTGSTQVGAVVENQQAVDLPLNGRDAMTLFYLQAGTNPLDNQQPSGSQQQVGAVDGLPPGTSEVRVEGILAINSSYDYSPSHPSFPVPEEAVGEYKVSNSGNSADDGPSSGSEVKALIKSGTNNLHGSVYEFNRNTALEANYFFNKFNKSANNVVQQPALHRNQYGFSIGGPIRKNKTFFFGTVEWQKQTQNDLVEATVYTQTLRQGTFLYNTSGSKNSTSMVNPQTGVPQVPYNSYTLANSSSFDTVYLPYVLKVMPAPNAWDTGDGFNTAGYRYQSPDPDNLYQGLLKFDHALTPRNSLSLTLSQYSENDPSSQYFNHVVKEGYAEFRRGLSLRLVSTFSPGLMNELSVGAALRRATRANTTTSCEASTGNITLSGLGTLCDSRSTQYNPALNEGFEDTVTRVAGKHTIEAGGEYWYEPLNRTSGSRFPLINTSNSYNPANVPALSGLNTTDRSDAEQWEKDLTGSVGSIKQTFYLNNQAAYAEYIPLKEELRKSESGFFVHDAWRLSKNLNLNLGLRWDILPPVKNNEGYAYPVNGLNGLLGAQGPTGTATAWAYAPNHGGSIYSTDLHALAPSVGVIWDPFGNGKSAVRASYHISNVRTMMISQDLSELENGSSTSTTLTPAITLSQLGTVIPIALPTPFSAVPATRQGVAIVANPNLSIPYVQEWTFGIDREIFDGWRLSATYVGNHAVGMLRSEDLNQVNLTSNGFLSTFQTAQANLAANGSPTVGASLGSLQSLFAEVPSGEYTVISQGQAAALAQYLDTTAPKGGVTGGLVTSAGLPATFFRYNPQFSDIYVEGNYGSSTWNGLKLELKRKIEHGVYLQANYTFSKGLVDYPQDEEYFNTNPFRDNANHRLDRTLSPLDATHVVLVNGIYELPFGHDQLLLNSGSKLINALAGGWQTNGIFNYTTGRPIPVTTGYQLLNQNVASAPNFNHAFSSLSKVNKASTTVTYITAAQLANFSNPAAGSAGNYTNQSLHGPGFADLDASLFKSFAVPARRENLQFQFRAEYFNVLNHTNFVEPGSLNINTASSSNLTSTYSPRVGQLALKLSF
jgi:hypothetical protein